MPSIGAGAMDAWPALLELESVGRNFGGLAALSEVSLSVRDGETHGIIGPNGAGKTTLFNLITGEVKRSCGRILFRGERIDGEPPRSIARRGIIRTYQITRIYPSLTVEEHMRLAVLRRHGAWETIRAFGTAVADAVERAFEIVQLEELRGKQANTLAHGDKRRLEIALAIATAPRLLMLDEPTQGMSPQETWETMALLQRLRASLPDLAILLIEHDMEVVMSVADRITVLQNGSVIASGEPTVIEADAAVQEAYLGAEFDVAS